MVNAAQTRHEREREIQFASCEQMLTPICCVGSHTQEFDPLYFQGAMCIVGGFAMVAAAHAAMPHRLDTPVVSCDHNSHYGTSFVSFQQPLTPLMVIVAMTLFFLRSEQQAIQLSTEYERDK